MSNVEILLIAGRRDSGKDSCAKFLETKKGVSRIPRYTRYSFADEIRFIISDLYGLSVERMCGLTEEDRHWRMQPHPILGGQSPVQVMQKIGSDFREIDPDTWVNKTLKRIEEDTWGLKRRIVITDCRYKNEALRCREKGARLIYIERSGVERTDFHESEDLHGLKKMADIVIINDGTIEQLYEKLEEVIRAVRIV